MRRNKVEVIYEKDLFENEYAVLRAEKSTKFSAMKYEDFKILWPGVPNFKEGRVFWVWTITGARS